jgi:hypothetical protein
MLAPGAASLHHAMPRTACMSSSDLSDRTLPRFSAAMLLPAALMTVLLLGQAWWLRDSRKEVAALRSELAELRLAHRVAVSHESLAAEAASRAARLEETLALMRQATASAPPPVSDPDRNRAAELERVISFLREEIRAAHETIERLKEPGAGKEEALKANPPSPGKAR